MFDFYSGGPARGRVVEGIGTGFIFDDRGHIHQLSRDRGCGPIESVTLSDGRHLEVEVVARMNERISPYFV